LRNQITNVCEAERPQRLLVGVPSAGGRRYFVTARLKNRFDIPLVVHFQLPRRPWSLPSFKSYPDAASLPAAEGYKAVRSFYSDLADEVDMPNPRNLNIVLDCVGEALLGLQEKWKESIPPVQCIVINRKTRIPSEGVFWFIKDRDAFSKLPMKQKRALVEKELEHIYDYAHWPEVLREFGIKPLSPDPSGAVRKAAALGATGESTRSGFGGGGESPEHLNLKCFIADHPGVLNLPLKLRRMARKSGRGLSRPVWSVRNAGVTWLPARTQRLDSIRL